MTEATGRAVYQTIYSRRDVRNEFLPEAVPEGVLARILCAAHHAPSVGLSQPWHFTVIDEVAVKQQIYSLFSAANAEAVGFFPADKQPLYRSLKLEGILEAPINICITCDRRDDKPVLGKTHQPDTDLYSTACAVQNLWLAAKAEGVGVGWVSIMDEPKMREILHIPSSVIPVAYLCVGYVSEFHQTPDLIRKNWERRRPLQELVSRNSFKNTDAEFMLAALQQAQQHRDDVLDG